MIGYFNSTSDIDNNGGDLDTDGMSFSLFGAYYPQEYLYVDAIVTYGNTNYDQDRNIRYTIGDILVDQTARAKYGGDQWSAAVGVGSSWSHGAWTIDPEVRFEYLSASVDSYQERISNPSADGGAWAASLGGQFGRHRSGIHDLEHRRYRYPRLQYELGHPAAAGEPVLGA